MASLKAEFDALQQQHEFTVMQLTDLKEDYEKIKKLNTTILQNMMKQSPDALNEIKLIIDGNLYSQKILDLELEVEQLRNKMNDQIQRRVQEYLKNVKPSAHDCQNCEHCLKLLLECPNCKKSAQKIKKLQKILEEKNEGIDRLRLQIQTTKSQYQVLQSRKNNEKASEYEQVNRILKQNIRDLQEVLKENEDKYRKYNQDWENEYNHLNEQYHAALDELEQYRNYLQQQEHENREKNQSKKQNHMMKQIQNILGELGNRKSTGPNPQKSVKYNSSRIIQDTDCNFSIKDAINRPNQFTYY